ncbi:MAG: hypothetical protein HY899_09360 [Deltaproteobacteria bacterium]|nr:hypothetical protein [Deltaproteobacteria bacterium]
MRAFNKMVMGIVLLAIPLSGQAGEQPPAAQGPDSRYPVQVTPEEAVRQKGEMRNNLVALRNTLVALADKDFAAVEVSLRKLAHEGPVAARPGVSTTIFRDLERGFEGSVDKTVEAVRSHDVDVILRSLGDTMAYCQACHMAFRQSVEAKYGAAPQQ